MKHLKIYPSEHKIIQGKRPRILDIPIASIDKTIEPLSVDFMPEKGFMENKEKNIAPYAEFSSGTDIFFDKYDDVADVKLELKDNKYVYTLKDTIEFVPTKFSVSATVKKNIAYNGFQKYNINVTVDDLSNWNDLVSIFGDAYKRGICPPNIRINNGSTKKSSIATGSIKDTDIMMIKSKDGIHYTSGAEINITEMLKNHTNLWISIEDADKLSKLFVQNNGSKIVTNRFKILYSGGIKYNSSNNFSLLKNIKYDDICNIIRFNGSYEIIEPYIEDNPVILLHMDGYGYIILSDAGIFKNLADNAKIIYDMMTYVYFNSYIETKYTSSWITDEKIDFIGTPSVVLNRSHNNINLCDMVNDVAPDVKSFFILNKINISEDYVKKVFFLEKDADNNLYFAKYSSNDIIDPEKPNEYKSLLTTKGTIMYYNYSGIKQKESLIKTDGIINKETNKNYLNIQPFSSSKYRLNLKQNVLLEIPKIGTVYNVLATPINENGESDISLVRRADGFDEPFVKIGEVSVSYTDLKRCNDLRVSGGGLPENMLDDYEMMDISNLYGRIIRRGTSLIIKLPDFYRKYDSYIREAINKYKNASTYIVICYGDKMFKQ